MIPIFQTLVPDKYSEYILQAIERSVNQGGLHFGIKKFLYFSRLFSDFQIFFVHLQVMRLPSGLSARALFRCIKTSIGYEE